ncbi:MAG TPA: DUF5666 domain-containing protein [Gammaproteobacteria bacterium]|nr:DUF5666 domain-containing protein [Gammaproteobacteria bacterium]
MIVRLCTLIIALSLMLMASCGGGGGFLAGGGIGGTGISNGTVTAFASVFVNGVEFDTTNATFTRNGQPATESDFSVGEVVTVAGTFNVDGTTGTARRVTYRANVSGAVTEAPNVVSGRIKVLGQTVTVTPSTVFENFAALTDVSPGNVLEVSGFTNADGSVIATYIVKRQNAFVPGASVSQVRGFVTDLNEANMTFTLDGLTVNYSAPQMMNGILANGRFVEVSSNENVINGELAADTVNVVDPVPGIKSGDALNTEGVVSRFASPTDFSVGGQRVITTPDTTFEDGGVADLGLNVALEVAGQVNANDVLVAARIVFRQPENTFEVGGIALAVNASAGTVTVQSVGSGAIEVATDSRTKFTDNSELGLQSFGLTDIGTADQVQITAFRSGNTVTAIRLERESSVNNSALPPVIGTPPPDIGIPPDTGTPPPVPDTDTPLPPDVGILPPTTGTPPPDNSAPPPNTGTPPPDVGAPPPDTGTPPPDVGAPPPDTGTPLPDTGAPPPDTGMPPSSMGTPSPNIGTPPPDAGTLPLDTGTPLSDSGSSLNPGGSPAA